MSSVNWSKIRGASEAKAKIAHNAYETRLERNHSNPHIDKKLTPLNLNFDGRTYEERCADYDDRVSFCKGNMKRVRSDAITLIGLNVKIPEGLAQADYELQAEWCCDAYQIIRDFVGEENVVSGTADFDEVHWYYDPDLKQKVLSRPEVDVKFVPEVNGKLCAKNWQTKGIMTKLNNQIEQMTQDKYHMPFLTGEGGKNLPAEALKAKSIIAEAEAEAEQILAEASAKVADKERAMAVKQRFVDSKSKRLAEREKALQDDIEALERDRKALEEQKQAYETAMQELAQAKQLAENALEPYTREKAEQKAVDAVQSVLSELRYKDGTTAWSRYEDKLRKLLNKCFNSTLMKKTYPTDSILYNIEYHEQKARDLPDVTEKKNDDGCNFSL